MVYSALSKIIKMKVILEYQGLEFYFFTFKCVQWAKAENTTGTTSFMLEKACTFLKTHLQIIFVNLKSNGQGLWFVSLGHFNLSGLELLQKSLPFLVNSLSLSADLWCFLASPHREFFSLISKGQSQPLDTCEQKVLTSMEILGVHLRANYGPLHIPKVTAEILCEVCFDFDSVLLQWIHNTRSNAWRLWSNKELYSSVDYCMGLLT